MKLDVATKVLIEDGKGNILLVKRKYDPDKGTWDCPGGKLESRETLEEYGVREVKEETGLYVEVLDMIGKHEFTWHKEPILLLYFKGKLKGGTLKASDDAEEAKWIPKEEILKLKTPRES